MTATSSLMTTAEVAAVFRVSQPAVRNWDDRGLITSVRTLGGHRRFDPAQVASLRRVNEIGRCPGCLYLVTAPGHLNSHGSSPVSPSPAGRAS